MISIDDHPPPDPSSSVHQNHHLLHQDLNINSDDLDLKSPDAADLDEINNNPLPNFSIRDYVFNSRSKNVACNWPFSHKSLQLCLKHEVKNLLPPFENLDLLRDNSSVTSRLPAEEIVNSFNGKPTIVAKSIRESVSTDSSDHKEDKESESHLQEHTKSKSAIKKSRSVMKSNPGVEPVEETMASKVCPVCKTFSSSSNTTLNAHIDQCLSGESSMSMKWTANPKVTVKHRIKPRKTRLMVDIYKTAPRCTVEELDRRNGTSWATNSSFPAQEFKFQEEEEEEPRLTTINVPEVADHEGDVYIDNNGTKVRILSSVPKAGSSDNNGARKLLKGVKGSKTVVGKKKSNIHKHKHHQKYLKLSPNSRKLSSSKPHRGASEARSGREEDVAIEESCRKDERGKEVMKTDDQVIIRPPWACSKRTSLAHKLKLRHESDKSSSRSGSRTPPSSSDNNNNNNNMFSSQSCKKMRTSSPLMVELSSCVLTKPSSKRFRKEGTCLHDNREDGVDIRSKGSKFSSLRKNLSIPAAKINLKRKFSAIKKSRVDCLSNEKIIVVPSQDSSNEQSRMEEDTDARKNEERSISITSKSLNGEESSAQLETANDDPSRDVESVRNETLPKGSFMGLTNSFEPEFSKLESKPNNKFDSLYENLLCLTNRPPDGKNIFGNDIEDGTDLEKTESYFQEVDPIPIPGPPGSFLPSPGGDMVSEELHSSLTTTSRVQSGETHHHHDPNDPDSMSNSPISTVSNPTLARSDSKSVQDDIKIDDTYKKSFPVTSSANSSDWKPVNTGFTEKGPSGPSLISFKNDQPCCCSRKEGALSQTVVSNYQESSLLRKRAIESIKIPSKLNFRSDMFSLSGHDQTVIFPTTKKSRESDCDSAASPSKPVLRLMGKDLTVVQTDDDVSSSPHQFRPPQSSPMNQQYSGQQFRNSFTRGYPQSPVIFSRYQNGSEYANPPINMRSHVNVRPVHGGFVSSVDCHGHGHGHGHGSPHVGPTMARTHQVHNGLDTQVVRERNVHNGAAKPVKEIIIIDDSPENEADDDIMRNERMRRNRAPSSLLQMNPLYTMYQSQASAQSYGGGSPVFRGGGFQTSLANGNLGTWNYISAAGSSGMMHPSSMGSPSPSTSTSHFRS